MSLLIGGNHFRNFRMISLNIFGWSGYFMTIVKRSISDFPCFGRSFGLFYVGIDEIQDKISEERRAQEAKLEKLGRNRVGEG